MTDRAAGSPPVDGRALVVDYGGVLTAPVRDALEGFEDEHGMPSGALMGVLARAWAGEGSGLIGQFERGEVSNHEFEEMLASFMQEDGWDVHPRGLIPRLFKSMPVDGGMWDVVARARQAGVRTALLSNSWGTAHYPYEQLDAVFDVLVISGDVGMRKPDPDIYHLTMERIGASADQCVFVDDFHVNVTVATDLGMHGVVHESLDTTVAQLESFLGVALT